MESRARRENQEKWMADEVRILVGTMAFGLGINKPPCALSFISLCEERRAVLPRSSRAGRDGLPRIASCSGKKKILASTHTSTEKSKTTQRKNGLAALSRSRTVCETQTVAASAAFACTSAKPQMGNLRNCDACATPPDWLK